VDPAFEQDWSGRGQHAEFSKDERRLLDEILEVRKHLGSSRSALVQSVKCRRIHLARKTVFCNRKFTKEQAVQEVAHIMRLSHAHVMRVIGTYTIGKEISILLYPVAEYNLETFLATTIEAEVQDGEWFAMLHASRRLIPSLTSAIHYIHSMLTKHMDIKPQNILVRGKQSRLRWM